MPSLVNQQQFYHNPVDIHIKIANHDLWVIHGFDIRDSGEGLVGTNGYFRSSTSVVAIVFLPNIVLKSHVDEVYC